MIGEPTKPLGPGEKKVLDREKPQTWKGALDVVRERALMKDPLNQRARELERRLQLEIEANRDYTAGDKAMLKGDFDKALINSTPCRWGPCVGGSDQALRGADERQAVPAVSRGASCPLEDLSESTPPGVRIHDGELFAKASRLSRARL